MSTIRSRLRQLEADDSRYEQLRYMLGTGHGITRIPQRHKDGSPKHQIITPYRVINQAVYGSYGRMGVDIFGTSTTDIFNPVGTFIKRTHSTTIIPEQSELMTEVSMSHYWALAREKRALEAKLRKYVPGHEWASVPHVSPFGADRFRTYDPTPQADLISRNWFEREGWCNRISGY